jgi:hypothetical protein
MYALDNSVPIAFKVELVAISSAAYSHLEHVLTAHWLSEQVASCEAGRKD